MIFWILAGLALHVAHIYSHALFRFANVGFGTYVGPRDALGAPGQFEGRALRATNNFRENLPLFLAPAILAATLDGADITLAILGAQIFIASRLAYFAAYISGVPLIRSPFYLTGLIGCIMIAAAVL